MKKSRVKRFKVYNHKTSQLKECFACSPLEAVHYFKWNACDCTVAEYKSLLGGVSSRRPHSGKVLL